MARKRRSSSRGSAKSTKSGFFKKNGRFRLIWRILFWIAAIVVTVKVVKFAKNKINQKKAEKAAAEGAGTTNAGTSEQVTKVVDSITKSDTAAKSKVASFLGGALGKTSGKTLTPRTGLTSNIAGIAAAQNKKLDSTASKMA